MTKKKLVLILVVCAAGVIGATAAQGFDPGRGLVSAVGRFTTVTASGPITANGGVALGASQDLTCVGATGATCIYDELGATCGTRTDDANAVNRSINSSHVSPFAAPAKTPGSLVLHGGLDSKTVTCAVATCDGTDTVIVTRNINGTSTANTLTFGTDFCTAGSCTTNALMASSLAAAIEALTGVGSTASSDVAGVTADRQTYGIVLTDSNAHAACTVLANGTDGSVDVAASALKIYPGSSPGTYATIALTGSGVFVTHNGYGSFYAASDGVFLETGDYFYYNASTRVSAPTNGSLRVENNAKNVTTFTFVPSADIGATCTLGDVGIDTGGVTTELCYCAATNTWKCVALAAGPAD